VIEQSDLGEPWSEYLRWGLRGNVARLVVAGGTVIVVTGISALFHVLELMGPIRRATQQLKRDGLRLADTIGLRDPGQLAHTLAVVGLLMIAAIGWLHADLLQAATASFNSAPLAVLLPMSEQTAERNAYQNELSVVLGLMAFGLYKIQQVRTRERTTDGRWGVVALVSVMVFTVFMTDAPYRTFLYREFERADLGGRHCYVTGETAAELLVLCPGVPPPRNQVVKKSDETLTRLGTFENVFRGFPSTPSRTQ
jgi:hypothetical protein